MTAGKDKMGRPLVVVTGLGIVTSLGAGKPDNWTKLTEGESGIKSMTRLPDVVFVIDSNKEAIAVKEARKLGIPVVAVVDTNCDPTEVDWVIPGNDDALRAIRLFASKVADSIAEGVQAATDKQGADIATAAAAGAAEAAAATKSAPTSADLAEEDELNMEEVLGGKVRKEPESETAVPETAPDMDVAKATEGRLP